MDKYGFTRVAAISPEHISIGNPVDNVKEIIRCIEQARKSDVEIAVFPELCITGYTCGDLFNHKILLDNSIRGLEEIKNYLKSKYKDIVVFVGMPIRAENKLFNCAVALSGHGIIAVIPKTYIPNYNEFYEMRYFSSSNEIKNHTINLFGKEVTFDSNTIIDVNGVKVSAEICEDAWAPITPGSYHCIAGAQIICNLSASNELVSKRDYRKNLIKSISATGICGYVYSSASRDESTSDTVYSGHTIICENGSCLKESAFPNNKEIIIADIDIQRLDADRTKSTSYLGSYPEHTVVIGRIDPVQWVTNRKVSLTPFVPKNINERAEEILDIQAAGLAQRLKKTGIKKAVIGISGGLDSTLALLSTVRAFNMLNLDKKGIIGITMPGFGTTKGTLNNSLKLMEYLEITSRTIDIKAACIQHLKDIGHNSDKFDIAYENTQARERTQILMDVANMEGALVIGTGDLSELALGWCTYNGDHMSMYAINCSIPKTLVRHLVKYFADVYGADERLATTANMINVLSGKKSKGGMIAECLYSILDTPVSPELLPPNEDGTIAQKTEDSIGNYNIHDFTMYYMIRFGFGPEKIYHLFMNSKVDDSNWNNISGIEVINNMKIFYRRFFSQQFKRNCVPDGIKVGSISLSPRADWRMPSDASANIWFAELQKLENSIKND